MSGTQQSTPVAQENKSEKDPWTSEVKEKFDTQVFPPSQRQCRGSIATVCCAARATSERLATYPSCKASKANV